MLLLLSWIVATANDYAKSLIIRAKDGTKATYVLSDYPKIKFTETDLVIINKGMQINYPLENMSHITYEDVDITNVEAIKNGGRFSFDNGLLSFSQMPPNSVITILTSTGSLVIKEQNISSGEYVIPVSRLNSGVYLVKVNGLTFKVALK